MAKDTGTNAIPQTRFERRAGAPVDADTCDGCTCKRRRANWGRRILLGGVAAWAASRILPGVTTTRAATDDPTKMRAQPGDQLIFKSGARKGEAISVSDVECGARPLVAYPYDPVNDIARKGSRFNQVLVLRLPDTGYTDEVRSRAAEGVIAYSAICTHENCPVTGWHPDEQLFICPCHETHYDPKDGARVVSGPAKRALPALPLTVKDGVLVAAEGLTGRVGKRKRT